MAARKEMRNVAACDIGRSNRYGDTNFEEMLKY